MPVDPQGRCLWTTENISNDLDGYNCYTLGPGVQEVRMGCGSSTQFTKPSTGGGVQFQMIVLEDILLAQRYLRSAG